MLAKRINFAMVGAGVSYSAISAACDLHKRCGASHYTLLISDRQNVMSMSADVMRILGASKTDEIENFDVAEIMQAGYVFGHLQRLVMNHPEKEIHVFLDLPNHMQFEVDPKTGIVDLLFDDEDTNQNVKDFLVEHPNVIIELATLLMTTNGVIRFAEAIERKKLAERALEGKA